MKYYKRITYLENRKRVNLLHEFRDYCTKYFNESTTDYIGNNRIDTDKEREARLKINRLLFQVHSIILASGVNSDLIYSRPPAAGGQTYYIDILMNIFNIQKYEMGPEIIFDILDQSIGLYERDFKSSKIRTFNPFFWIIVVIGIIAEIPFNLLSLLGFNKTKMENTILGRIIKGLFEIVIFISSFLTILHLLGILDKLKHFYDKYL